MYGRDLKGYLYSIRCSHMPSIATASDTSILPGSRFGNDLVLHIVWATIRMLVGTSTWALLYAREPLADNLLNKS